MRGVSRRGERNSGISGVQLIASWNETLPTVSSPLVCSLSSERFRKTLLPGRITAAAVFNSRGVNYTFWDMKWNKYTLKAEHYQNHAQTEKSFAFSTISSDNIKEQWCSLYFPHALTWWCKSCGVLLSDALLQKSPNEFQCRGRLGCVSIHWASRTGGGPGSQASPGPEPEPQTDWMLRESFSNFLPVLADKEGEEDEGLRGGRRGGEGKKKREALVSWEVCLELDVRFSYSGPTGAFPWQRLHLTLRLEITGLFTNYWHS